MIKTLALYGISLMLITSCNPQSTAQNTPSKTVENNTIKQPPKKKASISHEDAIAAYKLEQEELNNLRDSYPYNIRLKDAQGDISMSDDVFNEGKPTVILFWLTTCGPCQLELREITKKYNSWKEEADFNFYAISTDFEKNYERFSKQVKEKKYPWQSYNDFQRRFRKVMPGGLNGLPQSFVLDQKGKIVYHKKKYKLGDEDLLFSAVKALL